MYLRSLLAGLTLALVAGSASAHILTLNDQAPGVQNAVVSDTVVETIEAASPVINAPATWAVMLVGFGVVGLALRDRRAMGLGEI